ncbi:putative E3 ubiquitin-protein ligase TM129 isoform 2 [Scophthalmus maximus]|uniref:Putative E3 ubiquitin-protein ligase TM129 isoform 2 n=1 Tax=Scophthalmus maximus TaxID=52904 RepID=A0A2U9C837_SCOMX|nr:E3 ubiquitin-protein ligase TM129 isoform X1 [Scophthalmus maximus]AWP12608.1 putative E3 ubiquitin-protein ligase TM129 isoform 2 [Scophthalmus maximus]
MESPELSFTLAYIVFCLCFVFTPSEFRSAGLTIQNLFSSCLGSEDVGFVQYHIRRTSVTVLVHSALPLGYYMGMCVAAPEKNLGYIHKVSDSWRLFLLLSICLQLASWTHVIYWSRRHWHNHPISRGLQAHVQPPHSGWGSMAASVNTEFRRIDKFSTGAPGARVIVTDSWVLKVTTYHVYMALQSECHVTVTESRQHQLTQDLASPAQILTLRVDSINPAIRHYDIRLNSTEYAELREKLHAPIRNSANVVIHQTISELFLETFKAQVDLNQPYTLPIGQEMEPCIGCMQVPANTKLVRLCHTEGADNESGCQQCFCRPMWCLSCLGRWFASRQDQQRPETWLSSRVPCPTCRAKFCILDVCGVH